MSDQNKKKKKKQQQQKKRFRLLIWTSLNSEQETLLKEILFTVRFVSYNKNN